MTQFKLLGAAFALSAFVATPALAQVSEPAAAEAQDPYFSIYSNYGPGPSRVMESNAQFGDAWGQHKSVRPHHANHAGVKH
jgi:hypothetical protein